MSDKDVAADERIIRTAMEILVEEEEPERITVRQIAQRAGVAVGAINYHFQSKEDLLSEAVGRIFDDAATILYRPFQHQVRIPLKSTT